MESVQYETNVEIFKAPRNTKRVVAASAVAVAADQLQAATAATRHVREGVDESACEGCGGLSVNCSRFQCLWLTSSEISTLLIF